VLSHEIMVGNGWMMPEKVNLASICKRKNMVQSLSLKKHSETKLMEAELEM